MSESRIVVMSEPGTVVIDTPDVVPPTVSTSPDMVDRGVDLPTAINRIGLALPWEIVLILIGLQEPDGTAMPGGIEAGAGAQETLSTGTDTMPRSVLQSAGERSVPGSVGEMSLFESPGEKVI